MSPIQVFVTRIKDFDLGLIAWFFSFEALERLIFKGQIAAVYSWSIDFSSSWSFDQPPMGALIAWFPVANVSTCKWLPPKVSVRQDSSCFSPLLWQCSLLPRLSVYLHLIYCKPIIGAWKLRACSHAVCCCQSRNCKHIKSWIETRIGVLASGLC